jgi:type III restriction enzyme
LICDHQGEPFGFHYTPYNFDSADEKAFFYELLAAVGESPETIEDIYYTGAISSPEKTDFWFWYKGVDDKWHRYTPDFLFRRKDGRILIVEIKPERDTEENLTYPRAFGR